jgi:hypothetical protein
LENQTPAAPPININYAIGAQAIKFTNFRICKNDLDHDRPVNPAFTSFVISANNPKTCPIFFLDNKSTPQLYSFTVTQTPDHFAFFPNPTKPPKPGWSEQTAAVIDCSANAGPPPYQQSSKAWCCLKLDVGGNGVWAYGQPEPHNAHQSKIYTVVTNIAEQSTTNPIKTCNMGQ